MGEKVDVVGFKATLRKRAKNAKGRQELGYREGMVFIIFYAVDCKGILEAAEWD